LALNHAWQVSATFYEALAEVPPSIVVMSAHKINQNIGMSFVKINIIDKSLALLPVIKDPQLLEARKP
jgi:hypothetical protein